MKRKIFTAIAGLTLICVWTATNFLLTTANAATVLSEGFEAGGKTAYAAANVTLGTGSWYLNEALTGNTTSDRKTGSWSARVRDLGSFRMNFNVATPELFPFSTRLTELTAQALFSSGNQPTAVRRGRRSVRP